MAAPAKRSRPDVDLQDDPAKSLDSDDEIEQNSDDDEPTAAHRKEALLDCLSNLEGSLLVVAPALMAGLADSAIISLPGYGKLSLRLIPIRPTALQTTISRPRL